MEAIIKDGHLSFIEPISGDIILYTERSYRSRSGVNISAPIEAEGKYRLSSEDYLVILENKGLIKLVGNLGRVYDCVIDKFLKWEFEGCKKVQDPCSDSCDDFSMYSYVLLSSLEDSIRYQRIEDAVGIAIQLRELCKDCRSAFEKSSSKKISDSSSCGCNGI